MLRKDFLENPNYPSFFIYGGLLLLLLRTALQTYDVIAASSFLNGVILGLSVLLVVVGFLLRFYHARRNGTTGSFLFSLGLGVALLVILMLTGTIHTPAFLQNIFNL